ncbi:MAG: hypothetical protein ACSHXB_03955 [Sulfitobacter sp.]
MRRVAVDICEATAHLKGGVVPSPKELERITTRLREDLDGLHAHADRLAAMVQWGELS